MHIHVDIDLYLYAYLENPCCIKKVIVPMCLKKGNLPEKTRLFGKNVIEDSPYMSVYGVLELNVGLGSEAWALEDTSCFFSRPNVQEGIEP